MFAYIDIISTRKVRAEDGTLFLDMKCGNLLRQSVTRIQTDQVSERRTVESPIRRSERANAY